MDYVKNMRSQIGHQGLMLVAANVIFYNQQGKLVMQQKFNDKLAFVGGFIEYGESVTGGVCREAAEEVGIILDQSKLELFGIYSQFQMAYPNGDQVHPISIFFKYQLDQDEQLIPLPPETKAIQEVDIDEEFEILNVQHQTVLEDLRADFAKVVIY